VTGDDPERLKAWLEAGRKRWALAHPVEQQEQERDDEGAVTG